MHGSITGPGRTSAGAHVVVAAACALFGCGHGEGSKAAAPGPRPAASLTQDPPAQKLDAGLGEAFRAVQAGRYDDARHLVDAYLKAAGAKARRGQAEFVIALSWHQPRLYAQAEEHFARAVELDPGYLPTYLYRGYCLYELGRLDAARASLETYLGAKPDSDEARFDLGLVALEQDRAEEAAREIQRAIDLVQPRLTEPTRAAEAQRDLGRYLARLSDARLRLDDLAGARQALERSAELVPDIPDVWSKLHRVLVRLGEDEAAKKALARYEEAAAKRTAAGR